MCLLTLQEKPKRTLWPTTAYKVLELHGEALVSPSYDFEWTQGQLEKTELGIRKNMGRGTVTFANTESYQRYYREESVTEIAEGFHAFLDILDAVKYIKEIYDFPGESAVIVEMKIPAFSLTFRDECRMIVSDKIKLVGIIPIESIPNMIK